MNAPARVPEDVAQIRKMITSLMNKQDQGGEIPGNARCGVYAFYDYDQEPIYVGQTSERVRSRIGRHLTNQRTDAVAMNVLDPYEVAEIEIWPFYELEGSARKDISQTLDRAEFTVYKKVISASIFHAVLNEKEIPRTELIKLPPSIRGTIIPQALYESRKHPDIRIARRASTIAALARVISERDVQEGLRRTLVTQAKRLQHLSEKRYDEYTLKTPAEEARKGDVSPQEMIELIRTFTKEQ